MPRMCEGGGALRQASLSTWSWAAGARGPHAKAAGAAAAWARLEQSPFFLPREQGGALPAATSRPACPLLTGGADPLSPTARERSGPWQRLVVGAALPGPLAAASGPAAAAGAQAGLCQKGGPKGCRETSGLISILLLY